MHAALLMLATVLSPPQAPPAPAATLLELEARIPLGKVAGRLDHLAYDPAVGRLFVAEYDDDSVSVINLAERRVERRIEGVKRPQGLGWFSETATLFVGCGDGKLRAFRGDTMLPMGEVDLGEDADNVRIDRTKHRVFVGYGEGAVAALDPTTLKVIGKAALHAHPEGFQLAAQANQLYVNVPGSAEIAVVDVARDRTLASWPTGTMHDTFPLAIDNTTQRVFVVSRKPPMLGAFSMIDGRELVKTATCRDADDVFLDASRRRMYVICGEGSIDIRNAALERVGQFATAAGARTGLYSVDADRLFLAVRAQGSEAAAVWVLKPRN